MSDIDPATQFASARALEKAEDNGENIADMRKRITSLEEEARALAAFNRQLLVTLKARLKLDDLDLDFLNQRTETSETKRDEKPGVHIAPLCNFCFRPMQEDSQACIYCGRVPE